MLKKVMMVSAIVLGIILVGLSTNPLKRRRQRLRGRAEGLIPPTISRGPEGFQVLV